MTQTNPGPESAEKAKGLLLPGSSRSPKDPDGELEIFFDTPGEAFKFMEDWDKT